MDDCEDEGHEQEAMSEVEQLLMEAMFPPAKDCVKTSRPGGMGEYIKLWSPGTWYQVLRPLVDCVERPTRKPGPKGTNTTEEKETGLQE